MRQALRLIWMIAAAAGTVCAQSIAPKDKHLDPAWVASLTQRGGVLDAHISGSKKDGTLQYIGMPVGGIGCGTVYLGGDGRLWVWDIFNRFSAGVIDQACKWDPNLKNFPDSIRLTARKGANYVNPLTPDTWPPAFQQGFGIRIGDRFSRFEAKDWADVEFEGNWPVGTVRYSDPATPVEVVLSAFSPFIPLDLADSSLPLTCMEFTVRNTSPKTVTADLSGWLENAVGINTRKTQTLQFETQRSGEGMLKTMLHCVSMVNKAVPAAVRPDIVFADFEDTDYGAWTATGEAFGTGPIHKSEVPGIQGDLNMQGAGAVNSHASAPGTSLKKRYDQQGTLTSPIFTIERNSINFLIAGGDYQGKTCLNLLVDGKVVQSATGKKSNKMEPASFDVEDLIGKKAQLQVVDAKSGKWGSIGIDHIVFSDGSLEEPFDFKEAGDFGTMALSVMDKAAEDIKQDGVPGWKSTLILQPGESKQVVFMLTWNFPNIYPLPGFPNEQHHYAARFSDAADVARFAASNYPRLQGDTKEWVKTWYDSTLPKWFLDRTILTSDTLQTANCYLFEDGQFWAWEGVGACPGTCAHVWQYAQGIARLFPSIERNLREVTDYGYAQKPDGGIRFRGVAGKGVGPSEPAVDAQAGIILRTYREHQMSSDDAFLRRVWPKTKLALQYLIHEDGNADGILEGAQHNTLDSNWYGPVAWLSGEYLAALRAGEEMAKLMGDTAFAEETRGIFTRGQVNLVNRLYNGEYFINLPDPAHKNAINSGTGCLIDQVFGQSWAFQVGLGRILPEKETRSALDALWKYNFTPDVGVYRENNVPGRWYAAPGDSGLLMCTFPRPDWSYEKSAGDGNPIFVGYFNECMSGFEYQVASHMVYEGTPELVKKGLAVTRAVHDRYSPAKRNPYNEIECSDHYARAAASYGVFLAACGFEYNGPEGFMAFAPRISPDNFRAPFTAAEGWGTFSQTITEQEMRAELRVNWGRVSIKTLQLNPKGLDIRQVAVMVNGRQVAASLKATPDGVSVSLEAPLFIAEEEELTVVLKK